MHPYQHLIFDGILKYKLSVFNRWQIVFWDAIFGTWQTSHGHITHSIYHMLERSFLQAELKRLRNEGHPLTVKLTASQSILQAEYDKIIQTKNADLTASKDISLDAFSEGFLDVSSEDIKEDISLLSGTISKALDEPLFPDVSWRNELEGLLGRKLASQEYFNILNIYQATAFQHYDGRKQATHKTTSLIVNALKDMVDNPISDVKQFPLATVLEPPNEDLVVVSLGKEARYIEFEFFNDSKFARSKKPCVSILSKGDLGETISRVSELCLYEEGGSYKVTPLDITPGFVSWLHPDECTEYYSVRGRLFCSSLRRDVRIGYTLTPSMVTSRNECAVRSFSKNGITFYYPYQPTFIRIGGEWVEIENLSSTEWTDIAQDSRRHIKPGMRVFFANPVIEKVEQEPYIVQEIFFVDVVKYAKISKESDISCTKVVALVTLLSTSECSPLIPQE